MNTAIRQLANNPNAIGLEELQAMMSGDDALCAEVRKAIGGEIADRVKGLKRAVLPEGYHNVSVSNTEDYSTGYTKVFVWGDRGSGKTSVIGSLMSVSNKDDDEEITIDGSDARAVMLKRCFSDKSDMAVMPDEADRSERNISVHNVVLRKRSTPVTHRSYPITFVEVPLTVGVKGGYIAKDILDTEGEQIHLLCIDCTADLTLQGQMFCRLLDYLDEQAYIRDKTAGVFIVVTKTDTMYRVPRGYRDMAGQTMVTAKLRTLWQKVCNICYDKGIYGATPIIYNVGDVKLKSIVKYDLSTAETLWHDVILLKSQPMVSGLERVLRWGNGSLTAAVFLAFIALSGYGLYGVLKPDAVPPSAENLPYDYKAEFIKNVQSDIEGQSYSHSKRLYVELRNDMDHERGIRDIDGKQILTDKDYASCDSALSNAFADVINKEIDKEMGTSVWNDSLLHELRSAGREIKSHHLKSRQSNETEEKTEQITTYFDEVKPLVAKIKNCQSLDDVEYVMDNYEKYDEAPFTANADIADALSDAKENCIKSYSDYLKEKASTLQQTDDDKESYKVSMDDINNSIDEFTSYLKDNGYSKFVNDLNDVKEKLQETYDNLSTSWLRWLGL